ncbi:ABC transporter permease [Aeromicrobium sp.]|uniref:ABC transporter permease n=1 Tax=Aeromicrobium sp. TaxID=1871063 RepID=UPI0025C369B1|nr:ABC transporter permease [Aeromicrobium sp.]MCK5892627.1 ABC transporter permease [Aeromicrobium sp.]
MTTDIESGRGKRPRRSFGLARYSGLYIWALLIALFAVWLPDTFPTTQTLRSVADDQAVTCLVALALVVPIAAGIFDLSVAAQLGFSLVIAVYLQSQGIHPVISVLVALASGLLVGVLNAIVVVKLSVDSFIATLGMSSILAAGVYTVTDGQPIVNGISEGFTQAGRGTLLGVPLTVVYLAVVAAVLWYVMEYTPLGRHFYATGGNPQAARLTGLRVDRITAYAFILSGLLASIAGVVLAAKLGSGSHLAGPPYLLPAFSAAFLGATQIKPGRVNVLGTLVAVYLLATGVKGLQLAGAPPEINDLFNGVALIAAVALAARSARRARS